MSTVAGAPAPLAQVQAALARVPDPELPVASVVDLGLIHSVSVDHGGISVAVLPTFLGCPALEIILADIRDALLPFGVAVDVRTSLAVPWTPERITAEGRRALAAAGIAPPTDADDPPCPHCGSGRTVMDNAFGPTQCRSLHYCRACRQPFEAIRAG